jgi:hypothetical protein
LLLAICFLVENLLGDDMEQYFERLDSAQQKGDEEAARKILDDLKVEARQGMDRNRIILLAAYTNSN